MDDDVKKALNALAERLDKIEGKMGKSSNTADEGEGDDDRERENKRKNEDDEKKRENAADGGAATFARLETELSEERKRNRELERRFLRSEHSRTVDSLKRQGYAMTDEDAEAIIDDLCRQPDTDSVNQRVDFYKRTLRQVPVDRGPVDGFSHSRTGQRSGDGSGPTENQRKAASEAAVRRCQRDTSLDYASVYEEELNRATGGEAA